MKTDELIEYLKDGVWTDYSIECMDEIIKRLEELDKLRRLSYRAFKLLEEIVHL